MKKLLVLGSDSGGVQIVQYAKTQGLYTIVADYYDECRSSAKPYADECWLISTGDIDDLEAKSLETGVNAVVCGVSDFNTSNVIELAERLDLPHYCDKDVWHYSRNKADFKACCREYGVPVAKDYFLSRTPTEAELATVEYPAVVKPSDRSGNIGVSFCHDREELLAAMEQAYELAENGQIVVEQMLEGHEFGAYYAIANGQARLLYFNSMLAQPGTPANCYAVSSTIAGEHLYPYLNDVGPRVEAMLKAIGVRDGIAWLELMTDADGRFYTLEIGQRLSGEMLWMGMKDLMGFDSVKWMVDYAINGSNPVEGLPKAIQGPYDGCACGYILWTSHAGTVSRINGINALKEKMKVTIHCVAPVGKIVEAHKYAVICSFASADAEDMCRKIELINRTIQVLDENGENMVIYYNDFETVRRLRAQELCGRVEN